MLYDYSMNFLKFIQYLLLILFFYFLVQIINLGSDAILSGPFLPFFLILPRNYYLPFIILFIALIAAHRYYQGHASTRIGEPSKFGKSVIGLRGIMLIIFLLFLVAIFWLVGFSFVSTVGPLKFEILMTRLTMPAFRFTVGDNYLDTKKELTANGWVVVMPTSYTDLSSGKSVATNSPIDPIFPEIAWCNFGHDSYCGVNFTKGTYKNTLYIQSHHLNGKMAWIVVGKDESIFWRGPSLFF